MSKWKWGGSRDCVANCCKTGRRDASLVLPVRCTAADTTDVTRGNGRPNGDRENIRSSKMIFCSSERPSVAHVEDCRIIFSIMCECAEELKKANWFARFA